MKTYTLPDLGGEFIRRADYDALVKERDELCIRAGMVTLMERRVRELEADYTNYRSLLSTVRTALIGSRNLPTDLLMRIDRALGAEQPSAVDPPGLCVGHKQCEMCKECVHTESAHGWGRCAERRKGERRVVVAEKALLTGNQSGEIFRKHKKGIAIWLRNLRVEDRRKK